MTPRIPRVLPTQPVDVPHYAPEAASAGPVSLSRAEGTTRFDPAALGAAERDAAQAPALGALQGLVAVPARLLDGGPPVHVVIAGRTVSLVALRPAGPDGFSVCGVYEPPR